MLIRVVVSTLDSKDYFSFCVYFQVYLISRGSVNNPLDGHGVFDLLWHCNRLIFVNYSCYYLQTPPFGLFLIPCIFLGVHGFRVLSLPVDQVLIKES